jgi:hypothetical protein
MREDTLRAVLLVKAVEEVDRAGTLLPPADRAQATRDAVRALDAGVDEARLVADDRLLGRALGDRAERLVGTLVERFPIVDEALGRTRAPAWALAVVLLVAFATGIGLSALDGSRRINILAFPFLGLIAWNLLTYLLLAGSWLRARFGAQAPAAAAGNRWAQRLLARRLEPLLRKTRRVHVVLAEALARYATGYARDGSARLARHVRRWLHLAAAAVAFGLIVGLYVRGTVLRYEAGWESTFLGPAQVQAVLGVLFGPVAGGSGVPLPVTLMELEQLRWTAAGGGGDAAPWIHLIALSLAAYVVLPRLLLAALASLGLWRLDRSAALPDDLRRYATDVLRGSGVVRDVGVASVTPYAYEPSDASLAGLARWLQGTTGATQLERRTALRYGEEDMAGSAFAIGAHRVADLHVVLLTLAATPEAENHGVVIAAARDAAHRARPPAGVRIVVDESPYAARLAADASLAPRLEERRRLWRNFVAGYGLEADLLPLEDIG